MNQDPNPDFTDTLEKAGSDLKAKWSSLELPIQLGLVAGVVIVFAAFARYVLPAMLAAMGVGAVLAVLFIPYWLPTIIAFFRSHPNKLVIGLVNFFFGWTFVGWWVCLFWSLTNPSTGGGQPINVIVNNTATAGGASINQGYPPAGAPQPYQAQPAVGTGEPYQVPPPVGGGTPQYRAGDVVGGYRFDGANWTQEDSQQQVPPPPQ